MGDIYNIQSISQLHRDLGYPSPLHPLITLIDFSKAQPTEHLVGAAITTSLYSIVLKDKCQGELLYGRGTYDFEEGSLLCIAPDQRVGHRSESNQAAGKGASTGWGLYFHPDLIRGHTIAGSMDEFSFFGYDANEALHMAERERTHIESMAQSIEQEYSQNPDDYSIEIILSNLELLLRYCKRFYSRQFNTRTSVNKGVIAEFNGLLKNWYDSGMDRRQGIPSVKYFAEKLHYTPNYLGDLLKKETGKSTQDHIHTFMIERAKDLLLNPDLNIAQVAYSLGFEYPQHFSKLFKNKTGQSPLEWRKYKH